MPGLFDQYQQMLQQNTQQPSPVERNLLQNIQNTQPQFPSAAQQPISTPQLNIQPTQTKELQLAPTPQMDFNSANQQMMLQSSIPAFSQPQKPINFTPKMEQAQSFGEIMKTEEGQRIVSGLGLSNLPSFKAITRFSNQDTPFALRQNSVERIAAAGEAAARSGGNPYAIAQSYLGMNEKDSRDTLAGFFKQSGGMSLDPSQTAWCAAFANSVLKASGIDGTNSLMARSFLKWGKPTDNPSKGDIVVFSRGKDPRFGHVAFYVGPDTRNPDNILVLGGNQGNAVSIKSYPLSRVLGYRQPPSPETLQDVRRNPNMSQSNNNSNQFAIENIVKAAQAAYPDNPNMAKLAAAQAIHESNLLNKPSKLARSNNLFGIKGSGTAGSVNMPTWEVINGKKVNVNANFAANNSLEDSFIQHKNLMNRPRYKNVINSQSFEDAANAIYKAGYATDPSYTKKLVNTYNKTLAPYFKTTLDSADRPIIPVNNKTKKS